MQESRKSKMKSRADNFCEDFLEFHSLPTQWNYRVIDLMPWLSNKRFTEAGESIFLRELKKEVAETLQESNMHSQHKWQFVNKLVDAFRNKYQQADVSSSLAARTKEVLTQAFNEHLNNLRDKPAEMKVFYKAQLQTKLPHYYHQFINTTDKTTKQRAERKIRAIFASTQYGIEQQLLAKEAFMQLVQPVKEKILPYLEAEINVLNAKQISPLSGETINELSQAEVAKLALLQKVYGATKARFTNIEQTSTKAIVMKNNDVKQQTTSLQEKLFNNHLVSIVTSYGKQIVHSASSTFDSLFSNRVTKPLWNQVKRVGKYSYNLSTRSMKWALDNPGKFYVFTTLGMAVAARAYSSVTINYDGCHVDGRIVNKGVSCVNSSYVCFRPLENWAPVGNQVCHPQISGSSSSSSIIYDGIRDSYYIVDGEYGKSIWEVGPSGAIKNTLNSSIIDPKGWGLCAEVAISNDRNLALISNMNDTLFTEIYTVNGAKLAGPKNITSARSGYYSCSIEKRSLGGHHALYHVEETVSRVDYIRIDSATGNIVVQRQGINTKEVATFTKAPSINIIELANGRVIATYPGATGQVYLQVLGSDGNLLDATGGNNKNELQLNRFRNFSARTITMTAVPGTTPKDKIFITGVSDDDSRLYGMMYEAVDANGNSYQLVSGDSQKVEFSLSNAETFTTRLISAFCNSLKCGVVYNDKVAACDVKLVSFPINGPFDYYGFSPTSSPTGGTGSPKPSSENFPTGAVVGGSVAGLLLFVGATVGCVVYAKRKRDSGFKEVKEESKEEELEVVVDTSVKLRYKEGSSLFKNSNPLFHMILCWLGRPGVKYMTDKDSGDGKEVKELLTNIKQGLKDKAVNFDDDNIDKKKFASSIAHGIVNTSGVDYLDEFGKLKYTILRDNMISVVGSVHERLKQDGFLAQKMQMRS